MGCGLVSQRGPNMEVHHPLAPDPGRRAAGAHVVENGDDVRTGLATTAAAGGTPHQQGSFELRGLAQGPDPRTGAIATAPGTPGTDGRAAPGGPAGRAVPGRRFIMGERVVLASRMPTTLSQDHAFCFECSSFVQLPATPNVIQCSRCESSFIQFLRPPGGENWIRAESSSAAGFSFDDQLQSTISRSLEETPATKRPIQAAFLRGLPTLELTEAEVQARRKLDGRDPKFQCAICREGFCTVHPVKRLPCNHEFHDNCIVPWLQSNSSCPICRFRLPEATEGEEVEEEADENQPMPLKGPTSAVVGVPREAVAAGTPVPQLAADAEGTLGVAQGSSGLERLAPLVAPAGAASG